MCVCFVSGTLRPINQPQLALSWASGLCVINPGLLALSQVGLDTWDVPKKEKITGKVVPSVAGGDLFYDLRSLIAHIKGWSANSCTAGRTGRVSKKTQAG